MQQSPVQMPKARPGYIPSLDGLRAISILIVFASHAGVSDKIPGGFGVTVFFFLSGYLITSLLITEHDRHGHIALGTFYLRRVVRLGPPLLVTLAVALVAAAADLVEGDMDPRAVLSQIFFYYNYHMLYGGGGDSVEGFGILWSLSVEEHFYLIWPALFILIATGRLVLGHLGALLAAIVAWRAVRFFMLGDVEWTIYVSTDTRFDSLLYGCLLALMARRGLADRVFPPGAGARWGYLAVALAVLLLSFLYRDEAFRSTLRYTVQGLALMPIFHYAVTQSDHWLFRPLNWAPVRRIGVYSYTIYLAHFVIIGGLTYQGFSQPGAPVFIAAAAVLSVVYAHLVYRYAERPFQPLRKRLTGH